MGMHRKDKDQKEYIWSTDVFYGDPLHMEKKYKGILPCPAFFMHFVYAAEEGLALEI